MKATVAERGQVTIPKPFFDSLDGFLVDF